MTQNKTLKTILITFLFVGLLFSCKSKTPENKNQTSADNAEAKPSSEYNYPEIAKYATHINNLFAADDNLIGFWWDCSDIVIRKELTAHQEVIDGIMNCYENWPTYHKQGNGYIEESAFTAVKNMKTGWNMGNTLDSNSYVAIWDSENNQWYDNWSSTKDDEKGWMVKWNDGLITWETGWGQPKTSNEIIALVKSLGFDSVRMPVTWGEHISADGIIDPAWMARVKQVVDWAIDDGMYVVINIHHDNYGKNAKMPAREGFYPTDENYNNSADFVCNVWAQIALAFNNGYDEHLVFEVLNEPRLCGTNEEWYYNATSPKSIKAMSNLNKLTQNILDVIRASGGNNMKRLVAVPSLQASPESALARTFKMPEDYDGSKDRLIVSVHMYTPYNFAMESPGITKYSDSVKKEFTSMFKKLNDHFIANGYAVYIGEYGATNKNNLEDRIAWFHDFIKESRVYGMPCFLWDNGVWEVEGTEYSEHYGYYNRRTQKWYFPEIIKAINEEIK